MSLTGPAPGQARYLDGGWRSPQQARDAWAQDRRDEYLLRAVDYPLSWDRRVLPSASIDTPLPDDFEVFALVQGSPESPSTLPSWRLGITFDDLPPRPAGWRHAGFDVCDEVGYSALMNCGFLDVSERAALSNRWATHLNPRHLFQDLAVANQFRLQANVRVAEHSPFLVHGIYVGAPRGGAGPRNDGGP